MNKKYYMGILLALAVLLSSCAQSNQQKGGPRNPFIGGTQGLKVVFEKDSPPPEVTDAYFPFKAILNLKNEGEAEVKWNELKIRLTGFLPQDFSVIDEDVKDKIRLRPDQNLLPKARDPEGSIIEGSTVFVTIPSASESYFIARPMAGNTPFTFRADVCYAYQTTASARLCVLRNLVDPPNNKLCNPNGARQVFSSSSPIQVVNFRQHVIGRDITTRTDKIRFEFDIVHRGTGSVYKLANSIGLSPGNCPRDSSGLRRENEDVVRLVMFPYGQPNFIRSISCSYERNEYVRLVNGIRTVACTADLLPDRATDFESNVDIIIDFNYDQSVSTNVLVKHLVG